MTHVWHWCNDNYTVLLHSWLMSDIDTMIHTVLLHSYCPTLIQWYKQYCCIHDYCPTLIQWYKQYCCIHDYCQTLIQWYIQYSCIHIVRHWYNDTNSTFAFMTIVRHWYNDIYSTRAFMTIVRHWYNDTNSTVALMTIVRHWYNDTNSTVAFMTIVRHWYNDTNSTVAFMTIVRHWYNDNTAPSLAKSFHLSVVCLTILILIYCHLHNCLQKKEPFTWGVSNQGGMFAQVDCFNGNQFLATGTKSVQSYIDCPSPCRLEWKHCPDMAATPGSQTHLLVWFNYHGNWMMGSFLTQMLDGCGEKRQVRKRLTLEFIFSPKIIWVFFKIEQNFDQMTLTFIWWLGSSWKVRSLGPLECP